MDAVHGKKSRDLHVQRNWLSNFETREVLLADLSAEFQGNDLILEGQAIVKASFMALVRFACMQIY